MKIHKHILKILLSVLISGLVLPSPVFAEQQSDNSFIIKLKSDELSALSSFSDKVEQKFTFSSNPQFQNVYSFSSNLSLSKIKEKLAGSFDYVEQDQILKTHAQITPNDPGFTLNPLNIDKQWGLAKTGFPEVWDKEKGSSKTIVAVIDTGIDQTHEDFAGVKFVTGFNTLTRNIIVSGTNSDDNGHGTLVTGIIGASPNNGIGVAGTNWQISLMPVKALDELGSGSSSSVSEAIVWAADQGAQIINLSLGGIGFGHDTTLANAISYAFRKDVVIVAAAGNDVAITGGNLDLEPVFPICDDNGENMIIGVLATDFNDQKPSFSNFGKACIDVAAPGRRILSTINHDPLSGAIRPDDYAYASGTSMAVPFVVGQAALLKSKFPGATNKQIRDRILASADPIDSLNLSQCNGSL
jgi:subtilisin family serine protease